jgi:hypothetical protein
MQEKYGEKSLGLKKVHDSLLDDFYITRQILRERTNLGFLQVTAKVKKTVSFVGIYILAEDIDTLDRKIRFYKKKL